MFIKNTNWVSRWCPVDIIKNFNKSHASDKAIILGPSTPALSGAGRGTQAFFQVFSNSTVLSIRGLKGDAAIHSLLSARTDNRCKMSSGAGILVLAAALHFV